jgi:hypothetical protein
MRIEISVCAYGSDIRPIPKESGLAEGAMCEEMASSRGGVTCHVHWTQHMTYDMTPVKWRRTGQHFAACVIFAS